MFPALSESTAGVFRWGKMFLNVLRRKDLIQWSHVTIKSTRILQIAQGQFYFSNFFPFFFSHDAESLCCNLIYWCLLPDVLLAFAVEIFFLSQDIKYYNHLWLIVLCFYEEGVTSPPSLCGPAPHAPLRLDHLSWPIVLQDTGLFIGFWSHRLPVLRRRIRSQQ